MAAEENAPFIFEAVMTTTRLLLISFVLLCLIAFVRNVHAQDAKMAKQDMQAMSRLAQADMAEIAAGSRNMARQETPGGAEEAAEDREEHQGRGPQGLDEAKKMQASLKKVASGA